MCVVMYRLVIYRLSKEAIMFKVKKSFSNALVVMEANKWHAVYVCLQQCTAHCILWYMSIEIQRTLLVYWIRMYMTKCFVFFPPWEEKALSSTEKLNNPSRKKVNLDSHSWLLCSASLKKAVILLRLCWSLDISWAVSWVNAHTQYSIELDFIQGTRCMPPMTGTKFSK